MKIFAEERRSGSMETLMTLPVTEWDVVTGKYLASFFGTLLMIAPTLLYVITLVIFGSPDAGPVIGGYAGAVGVEGKVGIEDNKFVLEGGAAALIGGSAGIEIGFNDEGWDNFVDFIVFWD